MEIYVGKKNNWIGEFLVCFFLKLLVDFSNIFIYFFKDVNEDFGEDVVFFFVSFEDIEVI